MRRLFLSGSLSAFAVALFGLILTHSFVAYLDWVNPRWALAFRPTDASAELRIVNEIMYGRLVSANGDAGSEENSLNPDDDRRLRNRISRALYQEPMNPHALELLGLLNAKRDGNSADAFMAAAVRNSLRTPAALYWLITRERGGIDLSSRIMLADTLLRIRPSSMQAVGPIVIHMAKTPRGAEELSTALAQAPPWRRAFLRLLYNDVNDAEIALQLLLQLRQSAHPPTDDEIAAYVSSLAGRRKFELAYYVWLQFLAPEKAKAVKLLFNGNFRFDPMPVPFDWSIRSSSGIIAEIDHDSARPDRNILSIELGGGRVDFHPIAQMLVLPHGRYRFTAQVKGAINGPRGLTWQAACVAPTSKVLMNSVELLGANPKWTEVAMVFEVPATCVAETIGLVLDARSPSETLVSGSIAFADLRLERD